MVFADGTLTLAVDALGVSLSESTNFQTLTGAANAAAALNRIYHHIVTAPSGRVYTPAELTALRPYALIYLDEAEPYQRRHVASGTSYAYESDGGLLLRLERANPASGDASADITDWINAVDAIVDDVQSLCGVSDNFTYSLADVSVPSRFSRDDAQNLGDAFWAEVAFSFNRPG